jgi:type VI secretion system protein ImpI
MFVLRAFGLGGNPIPAAKFQFQHLPIRIGRNPLNDFALELTIISNFHACIEDNNGSLCIRDLGSTNGCFLPSPSGGKPARIPPNTSAALNPNNPWFILSEHIQVKVEVVAQQAPVRDALARGSVLGNLSIISPPGFHPSQPPPDRPTGPRLTPSTQAFQLDVQTLALIGLRELAGSLIPQRQLETSGDIARFITKLHDAMDVFCRTFIPLRQGYSEFVASLDLQRAASGRSVRRSPASIALEQARTPEAIAMVLLDPQDGSHDGPSAVEGIFADLMIHQVALLDGVMEGVRSLLDELSPESIERVVGSGGAAGLLGAKYKARWEEFCQRFEKLSEGQQSFSFVFGQDFAEVYRHYWHRKSGSEDGGLRTDRPPG